jgi:hypothetical protein
MKKPLSTLFVLAISLLFLPSAEASGSFSLAFNGTSSTITFLDVAGARTVLNAPTSCGGTVDPSWPTGTLTVASCNDQTTGVTANGKASTAHLSSSGGTGSFGARNVMHVKPSLTLRVVANDGSFDCTATTSGTGIPDFSSVMSPTLPLPPPSYVGHFTQVSSVSAPAFGVTASCSSTVAGTLGAQFNVISSASLDGTYAP